MAAARRENLFGTDGIRGIAGRDLTAGLAYAVGRAAGEMAGGGKVLVGMDTRPSGPQLSFALRSGLKTAGLAPVDLGVMPAGVISHLTDAAGAVLGVVISASHNPAPYNGIKLLGPDGAKLSDQKEQEISDRVRAADYEWSAHAGERRVGSEWLEGQDVYTEWLAGSVSADLSGLAVMVRLRQRGRLPGRAPGAPVAGGGRPKPRRTTRTDRLSTTDAAPLTPNGWPPRHGGVSD